MDASRKLLEEMAEGLANLAAQMAAAAYSCSPEDCDVYVQKLTKPLEDLGEALSLANDLTEVWVRPEQSPPSGN